jgi:hypothetical protein
MKKVIRLTESELTSLIKNIVNETEMNEQTVNPEVMETGEAILTIALTVIGMLGFAGYDILRDMARKLMKKGKRQEAHQLMSFIDQHESGEEGMEEMDMGKPMSDMDNEKDSPMMESRIVRRKKK